MNNLTQCKSWQRLSVLHNALHEQHLRALFEKDPSRFNTHSFKTEHLFLDYSKNLITPDVLAALLDLARERGVMGLFAAMKKGERVNSTEQRPVQHFLLRHFKNMPSEVSAGLEKMKEFVDKIHAQTYLGVTGKPICDVVNIGIGGSDLGPRFVTEALAPFHLNKVQCHFVTNMDAGDILNVLKNLNPETTLFIISSKSFSTQETMVNAETAKTWLKNHLQQADLVKKHMIAITAQSDRARQFGIDPALIFPLWDWVGGRYSVWSAIGLPIALSVGMNHFIEFLKGAEAIDIHFETAPLEKNMPLILALMGVWTINFMGIYNQAVMVYDQHLKSFPDYLQQVDMESNGKTVAKNGKTCDYHTGPLIWGGLGTNCQHSFFQWFHQGHGQSVVDFIMPIHSDSAVGDHHALCFANCISQSRALMTGKTLEEALAELRALGYSERDAQNLAPHKVMPGNHFSNTILMDRLTPRALGELLAVYEYKVFVQGAIWGLNSFDQWGVELGKSTADKIFPLLKGGLNADEASLDSSTVGLIKAASLRA